MVKCQLVGRYCPLCLQAPLSVITVITGGKLILLPLQQVRIVSADHRFHRLPLWPIDSIDQTIKHLSRKWGKKGEYQYSSIAALTPLTHCGTLFPSDQKKESVHDGQ